MTMGPIVFLKYRKILTVVAFVSGDFNLIHLHPLSARAFGFQSDRSWYVVESKCLALMDELPDACTVDVSFKLPIFCLLK